MFPLITGLTEDERREFPDDDPEAKPVIKEPARSVAVIPPAKLNGHLATVAPCLDTLARPVPMQMLPFGSFLTALHPQKQAALMGTGMRAGMMPQGYGFPPMMAPYPMPPLPYRFFRPPPPGYSYYEPPSAVPSSTAPQPVLDLSELTSMPETKMCAASTEWLDGLLHACKESTDLANPTYKFCRNHNIVYRTKLVCTCGVAPTQTIGQMGWDICINCHVYHLKCAKPDEKSSRNARTVIRPLVQ